MVLCIQKACVPLVGSSIMHASQSCKPVVHLQTAQVRPTGTGPSSCLHEGTFCLPFPLQLTMLQLWTPQHTRVVCLYVLSVIMHPRAGLPSTPSPSPYEGLCVCVQVTLYPPGAGLGSAPAAVANERTPGSKARNRKRGGARARQK